MSTHKSPAETRLSAGALALAILLIIGLSTGCTTSASQNSDTTSSSESQPPVDTKINQLQLIGSHNSYHVSIGREGLEAQAAVVSQLKMDAGDPLTNDYTHRPLDQQLDSGIRSFELDYTPPVRQNGVAFAQVVHIPNLDPISTCPDLSACINIILKWTEQHPQRVIIPILLEAKDDLGSAELDLLDELLFKTVKRSQLFTPDDLRGQSATLKLAATTGAWPSVEATRGKLMFLMDNGGSTSEAYREGHPNLEGRAVFTTDGLNEDGSLRDDAAALKINEPGDGKQIADLVSKGFFIRTRADASLVEAQANDTSRRAITFESGAQIVSTDFPPDEPEASTDYIVSFGGDSPGVRCNPVSARSQCVTPVNP